MKKYILWTLALAMVLGQAHAQEVKPTEKSLSILEKMDAELGTQKNDKDSQTQWVDAHSLGISDAGWDSDIDSYTRLPDRFQSTVTSNVWRLSRCSAGLTIRFSVKGTSFIDAKWTLRDNVYMAHMTPVAINGLDLYVRLNGKWQWAAIGKPDRNGLEQHAMLKKGFLPERTYECILYLPLYSGITHLELGFSPKAQVIPQKSVKKPVVFYGTSILHGCSASRPGMAFASILGRNFDNPVVNLGFSGNGLMEKHFVKILAEIDAVVYVIDCLPNMARFKKEEIYNRTMYMVQELRRLKPNTPIILVEDRSYTHPNLTGIPVFNERREGMKMAYNELKKKHKKLYYVHGDILLGTDNEACVDGSHPTDLGMMRYAEAIRPTIAKALKNVRK